MIPRSIFPSRHRARQCTAACQESGEVNRHPQSYHSGETKDVARIVEVLLAREKCQQIAAVGFSLGGNVLLKWLGELGATYGDIRINRYRTERIFTRERQVQNVSLNQTFGFGVGSRCVQLPSTAVPLQLEIR